MTHRISEHVLAGELRNTQRNSVSGWIEFAPEYGIRLELTGNFSGQLEGKHIRFKNRRLDPDQVCEPGEFPEHIEDLADRQIGVVQCMELRDFKVPQLPIDEFLALPAAKRASHLLEQQGVWLEWSSQNGELLCELVDVELEYVSPDEAGPDVSNYETFEPGNYAADLNEVSLDAAEHAVPEDLYSGEDSELDEAELDEEQQEDDLDDPYGLFDENFEKDVAESLAGETLPVTDKPGWEQVIPDIDPETQALYEQWDEIFEGKKDEPIRHLFPKPLKLPKPDRVASDAEAEGLVKAILAQLALLSVALDVCEHFSPLQTYRLLIQEILPSAKVHPNLAASDMVQHYATSDYCQRCEDEFDAEYEATQPEEDGGSDAHKSD